MDISFEKLIVEKMCAIMKNTWFTIYGEKSQNLLKLSIIWTPINIINGHYSVHELFTCYQLCHMVYIHEELYYSEFLPIYGNHEVI